MWNPHREDPAGRTKHLFLSNLPGSTPGLMSCSMMSLHDAPDISSLTACIYWLDPVGSQQDLPVDNLLKLLMYLLTHDTFDRYQTNIGRGSAPCRSTPSSGYEQRNSLKLQGFLNQRCVGGSVKVSRFPNSLMPGEIGGGGAPGSPAMSMQSDGTSGLGKRVTARLTDRL
jgi:hypothetical protein